MTQKGKKFDFDMVYAIWQFTDFEYVRKLAEMFVKNVNPESAPMYIVAYSILAFVFGMAAWFFDLRPSFMFAEHMFGSMSAGISDAQVAARFVQMFIIAFALTPTLLESFSAGFALSGSSAIAIILKVAIAFDAVTDTEMAWWAGGVIVSYFTTNGGDPVSLAIAVGGVNFWATVVVSALMLFASTILFETLFLSLVVAVWQLFGKIPWNLGSLWKVGNKRPAPQPAHQPAGAAAGTGFRSGTERGERDLGGEQRQRERQATF